MDLEIYVKDKKLKTKIKSGVVVKDLLLEIKGYLNKDKKNYIIIDSNNKRLKETDVISPNLIDKNYILKLFLIECPNSLNDLYNFDTNKEDDNDEFEINDTLEKTIMKVTGAKNPLIIKPQPLIPQNNFHILDILNGEGGNRQEGGNNIERLFQAILTMQENDLIDNHIIFREHNNNEEIEADEQYLRMLQDMGFPEDRARQALINSRNNINEATESLLGEIPNDNQ